jgi:ATP-dependent helicase/nuclease subunit A
MKLTPSQNSALDLTRHTAIIANAGSGKTRVLVDRYLKILEEHNDLHPRNIVAITFTDASARDLKKKIAEELRRRIVDSSDTDRRARLLEIRQQLPGAYISTIHSFCIQLLRTYPVEANVDALFTILASPEDQLLREECVQSSFYSILKKAYADENSAEAGLLPVFRLFGRRRVSSLIHSFLGSRFRVENLREGIYSHKNEEIVASWNDRLDYIVKNEILGKIDISFFTRLLKGKTKQGKNRQRADEAVVSYLGSNSDKGKLQGYKELKESFFTKENNLSGNLFAAEVREDFLQEAKQIVLPYNKYRRLIESIIAYQGSKYDALYLQYCRQLFEIYEEVRKYYTSQKVNYSFLDYDDVIENALKLVRIPEIQAELVKRFSHILIDEYQDTDAAQYEIVKSLTVGFQETNRLTVVGDPKQSIYSFRNAELELYQKTVKEISETHHDNSAVNLSESFRMLSHPLAFINRISEQLFADIPEHSSEYNFTPLIEARNEQKEGSVEILLPLDSKELVKPFYFDDEDEDEVFDDISINEVELIVDKIKNIISDTSGKYHIRKKDPETSEGFKEATPHYSDIAILLRARTHQQEIETELRKNHVPFITYSGKGFYSQPEIIDATNYLRFLVNPNDDIALAGILRSPYFGLSDVDLYRLAPEYNSETNLWQRFSLSDRTNEYFSRAYEKLTENLQLVGRVSTQFLLQKVIQESGILGILESLPGGEQKIANLEKFQRFALSFGSEGYSGTFDFVERMTLLMERDEAEAQAEPQTDVNAIHIMTIHNAKGLEFPIVFLPYLHSFLTFRGPGRMWNTLDNDLGLGIDLPEQSGKLPIAELIKLRAREREIEEEKRVFYVAMTRARDHLILSASPRKRYRNTRIGWVFDALGVNTDELNSIEEIIFPTEITRYREESENTTDVVQFGIPLIAGKNQLSETGELPQEQVPYFDNAVFLLKDIEPSESVGRYSPSQLLTFLECPTKYYLRYQLGLPEEARLPYYNEADVLAENVQGSVFGQILHKVLERSSFFFFNDFYDKKLLDDVFHSVCNDLHISEESRNKFSKRVHTDIETVLSTTVGKLALSSRSYQSELALRSKLASGQVLSGIIDRLFLDEEGVWNILDYKTDIRENREKKKRYEFQLTFYAYLVSLLYKTDVVKAHVLYTHSGNTATSLFIQKDFSGIGSQLQSLVTEIRLQRKISSLDEPLRNLSHCPECPYFSRSANLCIAGSGKEPVALQTELF